MLFLISPAKSLDYEHPAPVPDAGVPHFSAAAGELIGLLRQHDERGIAELMDLSEPLAALNVARYAAFSPRPTSANSKPALFAFDGDVYGGLGAHELSRPQVRWVQEHVAILSGLYGVLRPLDRLQPYRLEMGTRLANPLGKDLYAFWRTRIAEHLNERLAGQRAPVVVNLASEEYFKAVDRSELRARVVHCVFQDWKGGATRSSASTPSGRADSWCATRHCTARDRRGRWPDSISRAMLSMLRQANPTGWCSVAACPDASATLSTAR
ncbi:hypothetical protein X551_00940 [Methylibium sp. T29]|nr:hypothetical protein X551_00940 [Methylibium sp. T29]EWS60586.1 hypothetical protein Y694_01606 [Methylibium sp. T29-B]